MPAQNGRRPRCFHDVLLGEFQGGLNNLCSICCPQVSSFWKMNNHQVVDAIGKQRLGNLLQIVREYRVSTPQGNTRKLFGFESLMMQ